MNKKSICIINGHPDNDPKHLIHELCDAYADGADSAGHTVTRIDVAALDIPLLRSAEEFESPPPEPILTEREKIAAAEHLLIAFPALDRQHAGHVESLFRTGGARGILPWAER
jgi:putative NADPH-quinone reductase